MSNLSTVSRKKTVCNLKGVFNYGTFKGKSFPVSVSFDINSSDYIIASLSIEAITTVEKGDLTTAGGSCVDMEGYSKPPGELHYRNGSALVPGFLFKLCPKF